MIKIYEVDTTKKLKKFIDFPHKLYSGSKYWVPPLTFDELNTLRKDKNPAFSHCEASLFLAKKDGKIAGRIAGIINNKYNSETDKKYARFGWVDFIDDHEVSKALFEAVENWASSRGIEAIHGPLGFCDLDKEGMLVEGFEEPSMFITIYNYPYYMQHIEKLGYVKDTDWMEFEITVPKSIPDKINKLNQLIVKKLNLKIIRAKNKKTFIPYVPAIFKLLNQEYKNLYGFVPLTDEQVKTYTKQYFGFINPDYVRVILNEKDELVAFGIAIPSLAKASKKTGGRLFPFGFLEFLKALRKNDRLELLLVAVRGDYHGKGVNVLLLNDINITGIKNGLKFAETGPELETNKDVQSLWKYYEARQHKRRRCYIKHLNGEEQ